MLAGELEDHKYVDINQGNLEVSLARPEEQNYKQNFAPPGPNSVSAQTFYNTAQLILLNFPVNTKMDS